MTNTDQIDEMQSILHEDYGYELNTSQIQTVSDTFIRFFSILDTIDRQTANTGDEHEKQRHNSVLQ